MPLQVTYDDGTILEITTTGGHSIQVLTPDNRVEGAFALNDVKSVALLSDTPPPVVAAPAEPVSDSYSSTALLTDTSPSPDDVPVSTNAEVVAVDPTSPPTEDPSGGESSSTTDTSSTSLPPESVPPTVPTDPETTDEISTEDPHTVAVVSAITSLDGAIAVAGDVSNDETTVAAHVAQAQTDIGELLTQYPESLPLLDAKSQIDALAENFAPPAAA